MNSNSTYYLHLKNLLVWLFFLSPLANFGQTCDPKWNRTKNTPCERFPIQFEANSSGLTSFTWDFGDGTAKSNTKDPMHVFTKAGFYTVIFSGTGSSGSCSDTVLVSVKKTPIVRFNSQYSDSCTVSNAFIKNQSDTNYTKRKDIAKFVWNFGDSASSSNFIVGDSITNYASYFDTKHRYDLSKVNASTQKYYNAKLSITNTWGCMDSFVFLNTAVVNVLKVKLKNESSYCSDKPVKISVVDMLTNKTPAFAPEASIVSSWNFGDPQSGKLNTQTNYNISGLSLEHTYRLGPWLAVVKVTAGGCIRTLLDTIVILGPESRIEATNSRIAEDEMYQSIIRDSIHFTNNSTFYRNDPNPKFEDSLVNGNKYIFKWPGDQTVIPSKVTKQRQRDHVLRLWDFGDAFAPQCTTDTKKNKNVKLNCNYSLDSLPVHWYTPWNEIYKFYNHGQFSAAHSEKWVLCKGGKSFYKINYYPKASYTIAADTLVIVPADSSFTYAGRKITPLSKEITSGLFKIKKVKTKLKGPLIYTPTLSDETWVFYTSGSIRINNINTGNRYSKSAGTVTLKIGDQFELRKGDSAILRSQIWINPSRTVIAQASNVCIDTMIGGRDTFIQRSKVYVDSNAHKAAFNTKYLKAYTARLINKDTVNTLGCTSINSIGLALVPPNSKGLTFVGIKCLAPPSPPFGLIFNTETTQPGCSQRLLKFNFDSVGNKNAWVPHGGFLAPPLPGSAPWHTGYAQAGAYPTKFIGSYGAGSITIRDPGFVTVGLIVGNGRLVNGVPESMDTTWYHNAFRYVYLDARIEAIQSEKLQNSVCAKDTLSFRLFSPKMDSITSISFSWGDDEGSFYEERFFYYIPYDGPRSNRNDKVIKDWKKSDKWLYNYVVRTNFDGQKYTLYDTIVTAIIRKWSVSASMETVDLPIRQAFSTLGIDVNKVAPQEIGQYLGNGKGLGLIDTSGMNSKIKFGITAYRDALTFKRGTTWYRYTNNSRKDSVIISQKLHWRDSLMSGFDTLKQAKVNKYTGLKVTPGVYRHVYKKAGRYYPALYLRNRDGCLGIKSFEVSVGFFSSAKFSDTALCIGKEITLRDSIRYFAVGNPFDWLNSKKHWNDPIRLGKNIETKRIDFNSFDDTIPAKRFDITGTGPFKFTYNRSGKYLVRIAMKDSLGCLDTLSSYIRVLPQSTIGFTVNKSKQCITNNLFQFNDTNSSVGGSTSRLWDFGDTTSSTLINPTKSYARSGVFKVNLSAKSSLGCDAVKSMFVTVSSLPPKPVITRIAKDSLRSSYAKNNQWYKDGVAIQGANLQKLKITGYGYFSVQYKDTNDCIVTSDTFGVRSGLSLARQLSKSQVKLFPNPSSDLLNIQFSEPYSGKLEIVDLPGNVVLVQELKQQKEETLSIAHLSNGIYYLKINTLVFRIIKYH